MERKESEKNEGYFQDPIRQSIIDDYLRCGSVDALIHEGNDIPFSEFEIHRTIENWGIIKNEGRRGVPISQTIAFFQRFVEENQSRKGNKRKLSVEKCRKRMPPGFSLSVSSIRRAFNAVGAGKPRKFAAALVITPYGNDNSVLFADEANPVKLGISDTVRVTIPSSQAAKSESPMDSVLRVFQQEIYTRKAVERTLPDAIIPQDPTPFTYLDIVDTRVAFYHIKLPEGNFYTDFSSHRLDNHRFIPVEDILEGKIHALRPGGSEVAVMYEDYLKGGHKGEETPVRMSYLNQRIRSIWLGGNKA